MKWDVEILSYVSTDELLYLMLRWQPVSNQYAG